MRLPCDDIHTADTQFRQVAVFEGGKGQAANLRFVRVGGI